MSDPLRTDARRADAHRYVPHADVPGDRVCEHCGYALHPAHADAICSECGERALGRSFDPSLERAPGCVCGIVAATWTVAALGWSLPSLAWTRRLSDASILTAISISGFVFLVGFAFGIFAVRGRSRVGRVLGGVAMVVSGWVIFMLVRAAWAL